MQPSNAKPARHALPVPLNRIVQATAGALLIVLATLVAYRPALPGDVLWDDDQYVSENPLLFAPDGLWRIWTSPSDSPQYYPLVFSSFWLEARLWGLSTFGLHLVNVFLHALNAILLWFVLRRLQVPGAWLAGAMFALHPVQVESVAWITERKNVLSGMFYLLALAAYLRFAERRAWGLYALSLVLFACAILSKTVTCSLPVAILLCQWWKHDRLWIREVLPLVPFFAIGIPLGLCTVWLEGHHVGAAGADWQLSFLERVLVAGRALWFYVGKLSWPTNLVFNYPRWEIHQAVLWQYLFPVTFVAAVILLWRLRKRIGKGPLVAVAFFAVTLTPALGFFDVFPFRYSYVADHFQYHASMGLIALMAAVLTHVFMRLAGASTGSRAGLTRLVLILPLIYGVLTFRQASLYTDIKTLWRRTIHRNPASWLARYNLALLLVKGREHDEEAVREARENLEAVLDGNPHHIDAHIILGIVAGRRGEHEQALAHYRAALDIDPSDPRVHYNMGLELERGADVEGAIASYQACVAHDPTAAPAHNKLGRIFLERGDYAAAARHSRLALEADPINPIALRNLGMLAYQKGDFAEAVESYTRVLHARPDDLQCRLNLATTYQQLGAHADAVAVLEQGLARQPGNLTLMHHLAKRLATSPDAGLRDGPRAVDLAAQVVQRLRRPRPEAFATLAAAYAEAHEYRRAVESAERAIQLARSLGLADLEEELASQLHQYQSREQTPPGNP